MPSSPVRVESFLYFLGGWPRRLAAAACVALAALTFLSSHRQSSAVASSDVVIAARHVAAGTVLSAADLQLAHWPVDLTPADALHSLSAAVGRPVGAAMSAREPVTTSRMLDVSVSAALSAGQVAVTVTLPDRAQATILAAGATIDLYAGADPSLLANGKPLTNAQGGREIASAVRVLAVLPPSEPTSQAGMTIVIATERATASRLANQASGTVLATLRPTS
ncbi:SAF domain-containing protein [Jatrophihabitans sp. DSM 45814]